MQSIFGFLGSAIGAVVSLVSLAVGIAVIIVLWKAGALPTLGEGFLVVLRGIFVDIPVAVFNFLRDLIRFATSPS